MRLTNILNRLESVGLSNSIQAIPYITDEPKIPGFLCFANKIAEQKYITDEVFGQGYDRNETKARIKSVGEFLERLCFDNPNKNLLILDNYVSQSDYANPQIFCCYSENQLDKMKDHVENSKKSRYLWMKVKDVLNNKDVFIPAQMIFIRGFEEEFPIRLERITTGGALGIKGTDHAMSYGLLEVLERDACMGAYLQKTPVKKIIDLPPNISTLVKYLDRYGLETHVLDVTSDLNIPTIAVITVDRTGVGAAINVGSKAAYTYNYAIERAILESIQCRRVARIERETKYSRELPHVEKITGVDDRYYYWYSTDKITDLDFWLNNNDTVSYKRLASHQSNLDAIINTLQIKKFNLFVADITLPELATQGCEVLKVIVPELHPLFLSEDAKSLFSTHYGTMQIDKILE